MRRAKRIWGFEQLESRSLLAGVVTITGDLSSPYAPITIKGDGASNQIVVYDFVSPLAIAGPSPMLMIVGTNTRIVNRTSGSNSRQPSNSASFPNFGLHPIIFEMGGGNDTLRIHDTNFFGSLTVNMGAGNDTLGMTNIMVEPFLPIGTGQNTPTGSSLVTTLGAGNDLAILNNVVTAGDHTIDAGLGFDTVKLNAVSVGTLQSGNTLHVDMGPGRGDRLRILGSAADHAVFNYSGKGGTLIKALSIQDPSGTLAEPYDSNHFGDEIESGFQKVWTIFPYSYRHTADFQS